MPTVAVLLLVLSHSPESHPVPAYLPRAVSTGLMVINDSVSLQARLTWEVGILEQPRNHLLAVGELGSAFAVSPPKGIRSIYQHVALIGIAYQSTREFFHWGFQLAAGPLWYRAGYAPGLPYQFENRVLGYTEGKLQFGVRVAEAVNIGIAIGFGSPVSFNHALPANAYLGGFMFSVFADWR